MTEAEVSSIAVEWASKEDWNPGIYDASCFYSADPKGFFIGLINNEPVACISVVSYDQSFAFLGFYIVKPEYRGKGYGLDIWNTVVDYHLTKNIGLDGVIAQQPKYKKSGFKLAYNNIRYEGIARPTNQEFPNIVHISKLHFDQIAEYDSKLFPAPRIAFLKCWLKQPESLVLAAVFKNKIAGYSLFRKCRTGFKIGPLFADDHDLAEQLFLASNNFVEPGTLIFLDTPEINTSAVELAEKNGMQKIVETARMYTRDQPDIDIGRVFGVTTFELG
ncbi:MAG: GNAT family N-acetyltransferase [bacterium]